MTGELDGGIAREELNRRFGEDWLEWAERWAPSQRQVLMSEKLYLFALGGNGAGKTKLGSWWLAGQVKGFDALRMQPIFRQHQPKFYAIAPTTEKIEQVLKPSLEEWFPRGWIIHRGTRENDCWTFKNGAKVMWKTGKQDVQTFQSDEIDGAWIDEEIATEQHWKGVLSRGFRRLARILCTMTAEKGTLWFHAWIFHPDEYPMEEKEIVSIDTRENPYFSDCDICSKPEKWHEEGTRRKGACDRFSNAKGKLKLELRLRQVRAGTRDFDIRIRGLFMTGAGAAVVDPVQRLELEKKHSRQPIGGYLNESGKFIKLEDRLDSRAWLRIEVEQKVNTQTGALQRWMLTPQRGHSYVMGVDVSEGNPTGDYHSAVVIDEHTGEQCALAHTRSVAARDFGVFVVQLARFYNDAFVVVEANHHGTSVVDTLIAMGYGNCYRRMRFDQIHKKPLPRIGFWTDNKSKKPAVDLMASFFLSRFVIHDPIIYSEAYSYTWLAENREGQHGVGCANPSGHDDTMTALFCAAVGLRQMGWSVAVGDAVPQRTYEKSMGDALMEDATGHTAGEDMVERAYERDDAMSNVADVFDGGEESEREWIP